MNSKAFVFILLAALVGSMTWGWNTKKKLDEHLATTPADISICTNLDAEPSRVRLEVETAHDMIGTYQEAIDSLHSKTIVETLIKFRNNKETLMVGKGKFRASYLDITTQALTNTSFRLLTPCEFNDILRHAKSNESVYVKLAVNTFNGKPVLDLIYQVEANDHAKAMFPEKIDADGFFYDDDSCPCDEPCCCNRASGQLVCPEVCADTMVVNTECTKCPQVRKGDCPTG